MDSTAAAEAATNDDEEFDDDDYIPASLAEFVKQADMALSEHQQDFLDELHSPTNNQSADSEDINLGGDRSDLVRDIQADLEKVSIMDNDNDNATTTTTPTGAGAGAGAATEEEKTELKDQSHIDNADNNLSAEEKIEMSPDLLTTPVPKESPSPVVEDATPLVVEDSIENDEDTKIHSMNVPEIMTEEKSVDHPVVSKDMVEATNDKSNNLSQGQQILHRDQTAMESKNVSADKTQNRKENNDYMENLPPPDLSPPPAPESSKMEEPVKEKVQTSVSTPTPTPPTKSWGSKFTSFFKPNEGIVSAQAASETTSKSPSPTKSSETATTPTNNNVASTQEKVAAPSPAQVQKSETIVASPESVKEEMTKDDEHNIEKMQTSADEALEDAMQGLTMDDENSKPKNGLTGVAVDTSKQKSPAAQKKISPKNKNIPSQSVAPKKGKTNGATKKNLNISTGSGNGPSPIQRQKITPARTSRLFQPTAASKMHFQSGDVKQSNPVVQSTTPLQTRTPTTTKGKGVTPRLSGIQKPTSSSGKRLTRNTENNDATTSNPRTSGTISSQSNNNAKRRQLSLQTEVTSRFMKPTAAQLAHHANQSGTGTTSASYTSPSTSTSSLKGTGRTGLTVPHVPSRLMKPTAAHAKQHTSQSSTSQSPSTTTTSSVGRTGLTVPRVSSRLTKPTAAQRAREISAASLSSVLPQKRTGTDEAVARARERIRQRKLQEQKSTFVKDTTAKFSVGAKSHEKSKSVSPRKKPAVAQAQGSSNGSPRFAAPTTAALAHQKAPVVSMAQSENVFGRALRSETSPVSVASSSATKHRLTVPEAPKFVTTAKYGDKRVKHEKDVTLAQSTNVLAGTLRGNSAVSNVKRPAGLTRPQAPKFHTIHKRPLPKSSEEMEQERLEKERLESLKSQNNRSHPYKSNDKALHTGSSAGLTKVRKRVLTKPEPFRLSGESRSTRRKQDDDIRSKMEEDEKELKKQFRARPLPDFAASASSTFAVDMKSKRKSPSKSRTKVQSPRMFKARPLPKSTFKGPNVQVKTASPSPQQQKQQHASSTPGPFKLESVQRHEAFVDLFQEKVAKEEEEFKKNLGHKALPLPETTYTPSFSPSKSTSSSGTPMQSPIQPDGVESQPLSSALSP